VPRERSKRTSITRFLSVRNRLFFGTACMLIPLLASIFVALSSFNSLLDFSGELVSESNQDLIPAVSLQRNLGKILVKLYDEGGVTETELAELVSRVDRQLTVLDASELGHAEEVEAWANVHQTWEETRERLLATTEPGLHSRRVEFAQVARAIDAMQQQLDVIVYVTGEEMKAIHEQASQTRERAGLEIGLTLLVALIMASFFGHLLAQSILRPLSELHDGAEHFGKGELKHRVPAHRLDELGKVATAFNRMALRLERSHRSLRRLSTRDYLTNLYNAREFYRLLDAELGRAKRYEEPLALLLLDADHFKQINDSYGHQSGDKALRELAKVLRAQVREVDVPARVGGEEFAVILPKTGGEAALGMAERIRREVAANQIVLDEEHGSPVSMTVSIGLATYPHSANDAQGLFRIADVALYHAKQSGRNRVSIS